MISDIIAKIFGIIWPPYCRYMQEQIDIIIPILVAILTGGFLMLFIENQHITSSVNERYNFIMKPFYHKLSNYFKFVGTFRTYMRIKNKKGEYVENFTGLVDKMGHLAHDCIMTGQDYPISYKKEKKLDSLCDDINNIWYYLDRRSNSLLKSISYDSDRASLFNELGEEYICEVTKKYKGKVWDLSLLKSVSGEFYCNIWQPIQNVPYEYELWNNKTKSFQYLTIGCISVALGTLVLILLFRYFIPVAFFTLLTVAAIVLLSYTVYKMIKLHQLSSKLFR